MKKNPINEGKFITNKKYTIENKTSIFENNKFRVLEKNVGMSKIPIKIEDQIIKKNFSN